MLRAAANDSNIKAIVLEPRELHIGWAKLEELRADQDRYLDPEISEDDPGLHADAWADANPDKAGELADLTALMIQLEIQNYYIELCLAEVSSGRSNTYSYPYTYTAANKYFSYRLSDDIEGYCCSKINNYYLR